MTAVDSPGAHPTQDTPRVRLAGDLRSAYEKGARISDLAVVSHRAQSEVRRLLKESGAALGSSTRRRAVRLRAGATPTRRLPAGCGDASSVAPAPAPDGSGRRPIARAEPRRLAARVVRVGADTCFVVLPEWRPAIAVPVPTTLLLVVTGLTRSELRGAELTALVRPDAVLDSDLAARDWRPVRPPRGVGPR